MVDHLMLRILTPARLILEEEVDEVTAPGALGEFGVLPNHINFLTSLSVGEVSYRKGNQKRFVVISGGFAEVLENVVTLLVPTAEFAEEIDRDRALEARNQLQASLERLTSDDQEFASSRTQLALEEARLQASSQSRH
jgi:F-type H+-transporting ATPase subunit epsilon